MKFGHSQRNSYHSIFGTGLAVVLFRLHQYQGAQDLYARAYDIQSSKLGPEDKEVATTMNNTAGLLKAMGKLADAEVVYRTVSTPTRVAVVLCCVTRSSQYAHCTVPWMPVLASIQLCWLAIYVYCYKKAKQEPYMHMLLFGKYTCTSHENVYARV